MAFQAVDTCLGWGVFYVCISVLGRHEKEGVGGGVGVGGGRGGSVESMPCVSGVFVIASKVFMVWVSRTRGGELWRGLIII